MEERLKTIEIASRLQTRCRICGEPIVEEEPFFTDGHTISHLDCLLEVPS